MRHAAGPRRELGLRTLFNVLGPLSNPAGATHQVLGVYAASLTSILAEVLSLLGSEGALVVHGAGGLDEFSLAGPTRVSAWREGALGDFVVTPEDCGLTPAPIETLAGGGALENARLVDALLTVSGGPTRDVVCLNAGGALYIAGRAESLADGVALARETVESGRAKAALDAFVQFTQEWRS
jgi:anthranilate phosphoribosyltransferase